MKKRKFLITALCAASAVCCALALAACGETPETPETPGTPEIPEPPAAHSHVWGAWTVADANKPTEAAGGKATRTCTGEGECDGAAADKEYALPALTSEDYTPTDDTATCSAEGEITYTYNKSGVNVSFAVTTPVNAQAHKYGEYTREDGKHYKVCEWNEAHIDSEAAHDTDGADGSCSVCGAEKITYTVTAKCGGNTVAGLHFIVKENKKDGETLENATSDSKGKITYTGWEQSVAVYFDKETEKFSKYRASEKIECTEENVDRTYTLTEKELATVTVENAEAGVTVYLCLASGELIDMAKDVTDEHGVAKIYYNKSDFTGDYFYVTLDYDKEHYTWKTSTVSDVYDEAKRGYQRFSTTSDGFDDIQVTGFEKKVAGEAVLVSSPTSSDISTIPVGETIVKGSGNYGYVKFVGAGTYRIVLTNETSTMAHILSVLYNGTSATSNDCALIKDGLKNTSFTGSIDDIIPDVQYTDLGGMDVAIEFTITLEEEDYILIRAYAESATAKITISLLSEN